MTAQLKPSPSVVGVIPARYASTRFPGKLLADLRGKPVLQWTWEAARAVRTLNRLVVAAADEWIAKAARGFGAEVVEVFEDLPSGSDRVERAVEVLERAGVLVDIAVNIQGDEPMLDPAVVDAVVERLKGAPGAGVATAVARLSRAADYRAPSVVKAVLDRRGRVMMFSRAPVPFGWKGRRPDSDVFFRHIGIYAYRRNVLEKFVSMPPSPLELTEKLEQLRLLEVGVEFAAAVVDFESVAVDTPEDLLRIDSAALLSG